MPPVAAWPPLPALPAVGVQEPRLESSVLQPDTAEASAAAVTQAAGAQKAVFFVSCMTATDLPAGGRCLYSSHRGGEVNRRQRLEDVTPQREPQI
jgi:hypothetical protein